MKLYMTSPTEAYSHQSKISINTYTHLG